MTFNVEDQDGQSIYQKSTKTANDNEVASYDWLADSVMTSHVANERTAFVAYECMMAASVAGVGNTRVPIEGHRTVELISECNSHKILLHLEHVLHILANKNNLISLGRWDSSGGTYESNKGLLTLIMRDGM